MGRRRQELCRQGSLSLSGAGATIATAVEQRYASFCCVVSIELLQVLAHLASHAISSRARSLLLTKVLPQVPRVSPERPSRFIFVDCGGRCGASSRHCSRLFGILSSCSGLRCLPRCTPTAGAQVSPVVVLHIVVLDYPLS